MEFKRVNVIVTAIEKDGKSTSKDLDIPLDITANELITAIRHIFNLSMETNESEMKSGHLSSEYPTALIRGNKKLSEYNVMNGSIITYSERR